MIDQSRRLAAVQPPVIPTVARWLDATPGTISFGQGVVSYPPPPEALEAARQFGAAPGDHKYGPVEGLPSFIEALEAKLTRENNIRVQPDSRVVVTAGSNMGFLNAVLAIVDDGDEVILPVPYYFNHEMCVAMVGATPVTVPTRPDYQLDLHAIRAAITPRTRAVVTVSPNNPTGAVYPEADLRTLNALCRDRGLFHIHDEAYEYFTYGDTARFSPGSIEGAARHTISLFSFSKGYGMASWRVGYMVLPEQLWDAVNKIQDTNLVCPSSLAQHAALAAVTIGRDYSQAGLEQLAAMRTIVGRELRRGQAPIDMHDPAGAFYYFLRVRTSLPALAIVERLIREHRVAVMPGSAFGATDGCCLRLSYGTVDEATAVEGIHRLTTGIAEITGSAS
ncbi:MAG TPA: pyridoxal phosphate-dependent aminotransferase [Vicinamibacterales bacterium]|nr:pyridoxal phosphate-dependent aminotransferase [Vicinamibacterales bacterium]